MSSMLIQASATNEYYTARKRKNYFIIKSVRNELKVNE
jgi:hypothetical protein